VTVDVTRYRWNQPGPTGRVLRVLLLGTGIGAALVDVVAFLYLRDHRFVMHVPDPRGNAPFVSPAWMGSSFSGLLWVPSLLSQATMIVWLIWQHNATANLWVRRYEGLRTTPGWAVGWWFVPFASLGMPLVGMLELDRRSTPDGAPRKASPLLGWWWAAWVAESILPVIVVLTMMLPRVVEWARTVPENATTLDLTSLVHAFAPWVLVFGILQCVAAVLASRVVTRIDTAQAALVGFAMIPPPRPDVG
jgi:hypothetical protein